MFWLKMCCLSVLSACMASPVALAQTTDGQLIPQQTVLNILWEVAPLPTDRMSTADLGEARRFPMLGQTYYVRSGSGADSVPLYRLRNPAGDHRSDLAPGPDGYVREGVLGHLWPASSHPPGTGPVWAGINSKTGDHALLPPGTPLKDYQTRVLHDGYAYPRFSSNNNFLSLSGKQITITSNMSAGGALWSLEWNDQQFIDQADYGRLVQSSLSFSGVGASKALPTEGGDQTADANNQFMHGSPTLMARNTIGPQGKLQSTRAIPLEWNYRAYNGNSPSRPVAYATWQLGKDITLDDSSVTPWSDRPTWAAQVMRYVTVFSNGGPALKQADIEIPTAYLKAKFRRGFTCDAAPGESGPALREVFAAQYEQLDAGTFHYQANLKAGGVIFANDSLTHALGIYGSSPEQGGSVRYFTLWKFGSLTAPLVNKWSAGGGPTTLNTGSNQFQSWLVVGKPSDVCNIMQRLYAKGLR